MKISIAPLEKQSLVDFFRIHNAACGADWCFCAAWWVPSWEGWGDRTAAENHTLRQGLFNQGEYDGYILYVDGEPAGWCQCGQRDRLTKLVHQFDLSPDPMVWAITCFLLNPNYRGQGLALVLLRAVLQDLKRLGVQRVQGFPRRGTDLSAGEVWTGPEPLFQRAGFTIERNDPARPIYGITLRIE
jgi:GNAT superfamily N-acetyltransferase